MKTVLNKCPLCGGRIAYTRYHQYSRDYLVKKNGTLSSKPSKKYADMDIDSGFLHCISPSCDWVTNDRLVKHYKEIMPLDTCVRLQLVHNYTYAYKHVPGGYHYYDLYLASLFPVYHVEPRFPIEPLRIFPKKCCVGTLELAFEDKCSTYFVAKNLEIVSTEPFEMPVSAGDLASSLQDYINGNTGTPFPNGDYDVNAMISSEEEDGSALLLELINMATDTKYRYLCKISEMEE